MRKENTIKKSLFVLAIMAIMLFAMTITASAAGAVTGLKQTDASTSSVQISWSDNPGQTYKVLYSKSKTSGYIALSSYPSSSVERYVSGLSAGTAYYVKVESYVRQGYNDVLVATSSPIQVVTKPKDIDYSTIKQTAGSSKAISFKWAASAGATGYRIELDTGATVKTKIVSSPKAVMSATSGRRYSVTIKPYKKSTSGYIAMTKYGTTKSGLYSAPVNPQNVAVYSKGNLTWDPNKSNEVTIGWDKNSFYNSNNTATPNGCQVQVCALNGKTSLYVGTSSSYSYGTVKVTSLKARKAIKNKGFKVRIRSYIKTSDGVTIWSAWSPFKVVVPQAYLNLKSMKALSDTSAKLVWTGVANAQYYYVYFNRDSSGTNGGIWRKVKVSASTRSYVITGLKKYQTFGFYVVPVCKIGGKLYPATTKYYYTTWIRTVYR